MAKLPSILSQNTPVTQLQRQDLGNRIVKSSLTHLSTGEDVLIAVSSPKRSQKSGSTNLLNYLTKSVGMSQKSASFFSDVSESYASKLLKKK